MSSSFYECDPIDRTNLPLGPPKTLINSFSHVPVAPPVVLAVVDSEVLDLVAVGLAVLLEGHF